MFANKGFLANPHVGLMFGRGEKKFGRGEPKYIHLSRGETNTFSICRDFIGGEIVRIIGSNKG